MASGIRATGGQPNGTPAKPVRKEARGTCTVCGARLTSYNPGPNCYTHTVGIPWRGPAAPPR